MAPSQFTALDQRQRITPIDRLPLELMVEIFILGRDIALDEALYLRDILLVCSAWRDLALSSPQLWTKIHFKLLSCGNHFPERIRTYVARAQDASLDIAITFNKGSASRSRLLSMSLWPRRLVVREPLMRNIYALLPRCRSLSLIFSDVTQICPVLPLKGHMERLRSVHCGFGSSFETAFPVGVPIFEPGISPSLPALQDFSFNGRGTTDPGFSNTFASVPLGSLRSLHVDIREGNWRGISKQLQRCERVEHLVLRGYLNSAPYDPSETSSLQSLKKLTATLTNLRTFLRDVSAPNLEEVIMLDRGHPTLDMNTDSEPVSAMTLGHRIRIVRLRLQDVNTPLCPAILALLTTVTVVVIEQGTWYAALLALLLGIDGDNVDWTSYVPQESSFLLSLELLDLCMGVWNADHAALVPAIELLLQLRPKLRIRLNPSQWRMGHRFRPNPTFQALQALEVQQGPRFTLV